MTEQQATEQGYERDKSEKFFRKYDETKDVGVVCECGCFHFTLRYGTYELIAECDSCGHKECVYSG